MLGFLSSWEVAKQLIKVGLPPQVGVVKSGTGGRELMVYIFAMTGVKSLLSDRTQGVLLLVTRIRSSYVNGILWGSPG